MTIYNYDKESHEYWSSAEASESPLEPGTYLVPANATTIAPPSKKKGYTRVFDPTAGVWEYVVDHRGETVYSTGTGASAVVDYLGPIKEGYTDQAPSSDMDVWDGNKWVVDIDKLKSRKKNEINRACEAQIVAGFTSATLGEIYHYQSDRDDQLNLIGLVSAGSGDILKCADDADGAPGEWEYRPHTIDQLRQVLSDGKDYKKQLLIKAAQLKAQIAAATTPEEVEAITW